MNSSNVPHGLCAAPLSAEPAQHLVRSVLVGLVATTLAAYVNSAAESLPATMAQNTTSPASSKDGNAAASNTISCAGFAHTRLIDLSWSKPQRMYTRDVGGFGVKDALVVRFTTGAQSSRGMLPRISAAEYGSPPNWRIATLSSKPCDFGPQPNPGMNMTGNSITAVFALGDDKTDPYYPVLQTTRTYYLNIRNSADSNCAASGVCDMFVDLVKSGGL